MQNRWKDADELEDAYHRELKRQQDEQLQEESIDAASEQLQEESSDAASGSSGTTSRHAVDSRASAMSHEGSAMSDKEQPLVKKGLPGLTRVMPKADGLSEPPSPPTHWTTKHRELLPDNWKQLPKAHIATHMYRKNATTYGHDLRHPPTSAMAFQASGPQVRVTSDEPSPDRIAPELMEALLATAGHPDLPEATSATALADMKAILAKAGRPDFPKATNAAALTAEAHAEFPSDDPSSSIHTNRERYFASLAAHAKACKARTDALDEIMAAQAAVKKR